MKLRLPNKLQAALIAALASVSFTTLSTGNVAMATNTVISNANQSATQLVSGDITLGSITSSMVRASGTAATPGQTNYRNSFTYTPVNIGSGSGGTATYTLDFTITDIADGVTAQGMVIDFFTLNGQGKPQVNKNGYNATVVLTMTGQQDPLYNTVHEIVSPSGNNNYTGSAYGADSLTPVDGSASFKILKLQDVEWKTGNYTLTITFTQNSGYKAGCFGGVGNIAFLSAPVSYDYTWAAAEPGTDWMSTDAWTNGGESATFTAGGNATFDSNGTNQVGIATAVSANTVTVSERDYTFNLSGDGASLTANALNVTSDQLTIQGGAVTTGTLTVGDAASVSLSGSGSLAVTGGVTLGEGAGITVGTDATLKVADAATAKALMMGTQVTNSGTFELACEMQLDAGTSTVMGGALKVASGATLKLSNSKGKPTSIESFSSVELAGGNLWANTTMRTINALSVTGDSQISFEDFPDDYANNPTKFTGTTRIADGKTLTIYTNFKSSIQIAGLAGAGTLKLTTANRSDNGENVTIDSLEGFSGNISLAPGNANNPVRVTASLGNADVSMGTLSLNGNSAAATDTKHTFYKLTGEHNLTMTGIDGTKGEVSLTVPTLTLNTDTNHSYTGSLAIGGQLVKTGSGTQTLGGFAINKTILVQGGTLTLNGTYTLDGLADDEGRTYTFEDETGAAADKTVGGFRITNGTKTVYTANGGAVSRADGTKFQLDGKDVEVDANGVYSFPGSADKTTLWVNGGSLNYDAYYAASGEETKALTTAKVAGGATLAIGEHAVGTLEYQTNGSTIGLSGTGRVNAISGTGTLNLESGAVVTLGYAPTVASGQTFTTTGMGELVAEYIASTGGTATIGSRLHLTKANDRTKGLSVTNANGSIAINDDAAIDGSMYVSAGSVTIGGGRVEVGRIEFGDVGSAAASELTVNAGATLHVKGGDVSANYHSTGLLLGEWAGISTLTVFGNLYADLATAQVGDKQANLNIENGGVMAVKGVGINDAGSGKSDKDQIINLNLKDGGKLVLGASGISSNKTFSAEFGHAEVGMTADTTLAKDITLTSSEGTTFNTTKYKWEGEGAQLTLATDTVGGTMTVSGALGGTGKLIANGAGTLVLSGANTYSGGTTVNAGTLKAASTSALGAGDVTVNGGTLELTSSISTQGNLSITGGTLVFAGADMLTAGSLAVSGTVTFDLNNISAIKAGTITLATGTAANGALSNVNVSWTLPSGFEYQNLRAQDNAWVIDLVSTGQALTWAGGTGNWSYSEQDLSWLTPGDEPTPTHFTDKDSAVFKEALDPAVANITDAISTAGVEIQAGANVTLQAATGEETASLTVAELEIGGTLTTSVDVTATEVAATGADAAWNITAGSVTADSITVAQDGKLALSGTGMTTGTVSGPGTVVVTDGFTLTLTQQIDSEEATDLTAIRNSGTVAVALGGSQNVINMDAASTGTLEVTAGTISSQSALGDQTLKLATGTVFAVKGSETAFANGITLAGNASMQLKDSANATLAGAVSGSGKTLSVSGGGANQVITFTNTVTLGGLDVTGGGEKLVFKGTGSSLGNIYARSGAFTIQFSKEDGADAAAYTFGTFAMSPVSSTGNRWLIVDQGVTVHATGSSLDPGASISSGWGVGNGGLLVNGILTTDGAIGLEANKQTAYIKGTGTINTAGLNFCNGSYTYIQDGITINITSNRGIFARSSTAAAGEVHLKDATLQAIDADWEFQVGREADPVTLEDASTGTTFEAANGHTITISKVLEGNGKLVKAGAGTVLLKGANTYTGGTEINAGTLAVAGNGAIGAVTIAQNATLRMDKGYTFTGTVSGAGKMAYAGTAAATLNFGDKDISGWTGSFDNTSSAAVTLNINTTSLNMDITHTGTGLVNLGLGVDNVHIAGEQLVNNVTHNASWTTYIDATGAVTATGTVLTGRVVVGQESTETDALFTLSGENAMLNKGGSEHSYAGLVQGYGTFKLVESATQTLTGDITGFLGTFMADGAGSILTIESALASDVTLRAIGGGEIILKSDVKNAAVESGTFDLLANVETLAVSGDNNTLNIGTGTVGNISLCGNLTANGSMYIHSGSIGTVVKAEAGKTLAVNGTAHVDGRVEFRSSEAAVQIQSHASGTTQYALENGNFDVTADMVEKVAAVDVTIANKVSAHTVKNAEGAGKLSLTTGVDMAALKKVFATSGDIEFLNVDAATKATLDTLDIAAGKTVSFSTNGTIADVVTEASVTVTGTLTAGVDATLNANLVMDGSAAHKETSAPAVLDVHAMGGNGGLNMGSSVTLNPYNVALSNDDMELIGDLGFMGKYDLFNGVDSFTVGETTYSQIGMSDTWVKASEVFSNDFGGKDYYVFYSGVNAGGNGSNVGAVYVMQIPEPTTGTLSLLALAALAARRRRK